MSRYTQADIGKIKTYSIAQRSSKVNPELFAKPKPDSIGKLVESLPKILKGSDFKEFIRHSADAITAGKGFIVGLGGHVIKCGLSPLLISMMESGYISCIAVNGSVGIHDFELAMYGHTSEDVAKNLSDGSFGMVDETNRIINTVVSEASAQGLGYGEALGKYLLQQAPYRDVSLFAMAYQYGMPITVHVAMGTDIIHQTPYADGKAIGDCSMRDFRIFCHQVSRLDAGGVYLNLGSAVILPEVFLKALTVARNICGRVQDFYTAVFDMNSHYRAVENVMRRPVENGGNGYYFIGHHEIMIPLYLAALNQALEQNKS